jgi:uncharacterized DUF497 family protein
MASGDVDKAVANLRKRGITIEQAAKALIDSLLLEGF